MLIGTLKRKTMSLTLTISDYISLGTLAIISGQLYFIYKTYKADHERRKKQSTIEYLNLIRKLYRPLKEKIDKDIEEENVINIKDMNDVTMRRTKNILSVLEHLCVGINTGVYDFEILNRMSGRYLIKLYERFAPYIELEQRKYSDTYIEFQHIYSQLKQISLKKLDEDGNIIHA